MLFITNERSHWCAGICAGKQKQKKKTDSLHPFWAKFDQCWAVTMDQLLAHHRARSHVIYSPISPHVCHVTGSSSSRLEKRRPLGPTQFGSLARGSSSLCETTEENNECLTDGGLRVGRVCACLSSLYHFIVQDFRTKAQACHGETWKLPWLTDMAACSEWRTK